MFPESEIENSGRSWGLICPGKTSVKKGTEHLITRTHELESPDGFPAYLAFDMVEMDDQNFVHAFPPETNLLMCWDGSGLPRLRRRTFQYNGSIGFILRKVMEDKLDWYYAWEAKRFTDSGKWFQCVHCDLDADIYLVMAFGHVDCQKDLIVNRQMLSLCSKALINKAVSLYDRIIVDSDETADLISKIVGSSAGKIEIK